MKSIEITMKKTYKWLLLLTIILAANLSAQVASVTWPLTSTQNANTPIGSIAALPESIGTGSGSYILSVFSPYVANGQRLWTGNQGTGWIAGLPDYTRYIQFDASPTTGNNFTVQYVSFNYSDNPLGVDFNILKSEVWYSTDGWNNKTQLNSTPLDYLNTSVQTFSKSMNVQVLNGQTFSVRIYPYAPNGGSARTQSWATHKNVIIEGRTSPIVLNNGSICGMKFDDWDGNGVKDEANGGLAGWTINLSMGAVQMTATTGADGSYCFNNLAAGTYILSETPQSGWRQTYPDSLGTQSVTLTSGQSVVNIDFGNKRTLGSISGTKFNDINGTGDQQNLNEPGLPNWTINLTGPVSTSTTTDANGLYHFNNLPAGTYTVTETNQSGWQQIYPYSPGSYTIILSEGQLVYSKDFANQIIPPQTGSICGMKFNDLNGNGRKDSGETGLSGWTITLSMGAVQMTATTGADGSFCFNNLAAGTYTLTETQQSGWQQTAPASPGTQSVTLAAGQRVENINFGNMELLGSICGMKFNDLNGNGRKDSGELGLSGWTINLSMGAVQMTATTGADGSYCFNNLTAGTYTLTETQQSGWQQTAPAAPGVYSISLGAGQLLENQNFGNQKDPCSDETKSWSMLGNGVNANVWSFASIGTDLYVGGGFTTAGGVSANHIAKWNGSSWSPLNTGISVPVYALTVMNGTLYAGGGSTNSGVVYKWDGSNWSSLGSGMNGTVRALAVMGGELYAGGNFTTADGISASNIAKWNGTNWIALGIGTGLNNEVFALAVFNGELYAGGAFTTANGVSANRIAKWNGSNWLALGTGLNQQVRSFAVMGTELYVGGLFSTAGGLSANSIAKWNGTNWSGLVSGMNGFVNSMAVIGQSLYVAGSFTIVIGGVNAHFVVKWDATTQLWTNLSAGFSGDVYAITANGFDIYAGVNNLTEIGKYSCSTTVELGSICGIKFNDLNGNGRKDSGETGLSGWTITLSMGAVQMTATTGADGSYCFDNLAAGTYTLTETQQSGWQQTTPASPGTQSVTLAAGQRVLNVDFGNMQIFGSICGIKFNDLNGNGRKDDGEPGLPNWQFNLTGTSNQTTKTDLRGNFCFTNLRAGSYTIQEVIQNGWEPTLPNNTGTFSVTLLPGQNLSEVYFGNKEILGSICGMKYNDLNGNGRWDIGEPGLPNWQITLSSFGYTSSGHSSGPTLDLISTITTDQNGNYCFNNLKQGYYLMGEVMQSGWSQTEPANIIYGITLTPGQKIEGRNFGNKVDVTVRLGSICGIKFNDKNGNGRQDDGELGIPNWQIQLSGSIDMTAVTDKNGNFCFENLLPGEYKVGEVMKTGWRQTVPSTNFYIIQLASGQNLTNIIFGNKEDATVQLGSICGIKFNDKNGDARQNDGELGIPNWTIYLTGSMNLTAVTDDNGNFCFYGLIPGSYTIREENKVGWRQTSPSSGTYSFDLKYGDNFTEVNFGNKEDATIKLGSICGMKFNDLNGNGRKDDGEPGIPNWAINLTGTMNLSTKTDSRGYFCFENLKFGKYTVSEVNRDRWIQTAPSTGSFTIELTEVRNPDDLYFGNKEDITVRLGSICGIKFNDKNENGIQDTGELGIPDWQINIGGPIDLNIKTDKDGKYCFDNLLPGTYVIKEELQTDWIQTFPASPGSYTVVLTSGQNLKDYKFGNKYEPKVGCVQPPSGMVAWWTLDESYHSKWFDFAGYNNFGTLVNGPIPVAAKVLGGLQFDGIDDYVEVADHAELNFGIGDFSFDAWIKTSENSGIQMLVSKRSSTGYAVFLNSGYLGLILSVPSIAAMNWSPNVFVADGNWHHIALTVSRTNSQGIVFYLDGIATPYGDPTQYQGSLTNSAPLKIGTQQLPNPSFYFKGILDEIELFNRVLTQAEIVSIFNAGSSGKCKPSSSVSSVWGHVFHDLNFDGVINGTESGLSNWTVFLNGPTIATTYTDVYGNFGFTDLKPGNYTISVAVQTGWSYTKPIRGNYTFEIAPDINIDAFNFGFGNNPCLSGLKTWSPLGTGISGQVYALAAAGGNLYAGGYLFTAGGVNVNNIAKWDGTNWTSLGSGIDGIVYSLAVNGTDLYVGGAFNTAGGVSAKNIAKWNGSSWSAIGNGTNGTVLALAVSGTSLYAGGQFTTAGSVSANRIAKWDGSNWSALGSGMDADVVALAVSGSTLYASGFFHTAGGIYTSNIAKWDGLSWSALGGGMSSGNFWSSSRVRALVVSGSVLYAGGNFDYAGNVSAKFVAKWDIGNSSWSALGSGISNDDVWAIAPSGDAIYVGGQFSTSGSVSTARVSKWDESISNWSALGTGVSGGYDNVTSLVEMGGALYAGGSFSTAGSVNANNIAKYSCSSATTSVKDDKQDNSLPQQFQLSQNYPNPFNPTSTIRYDLPKASFVKISVYDILGREIRVLVNEEKNSGHYEILFDARELSSGVYFYTIRTRDYTQSKKMILMK